jgi:molecular chaperone DnaK (HSP70)
MSDVIVGIDLGTTNSALAVPRNGRIELIGEEDGTELLPSCVGLTPDGSLVVGREARNQYILYPERTVVSIKRRMGSDDRILLGDRTYSPQEISAMILRELKLRAERHLGQEVNRAVITVPAYFSDAARNATREAGVIAGLEVMRIINEPTAACLAYETHTHTESHNVVAFDLGGGTFDVSVVRVHQDVVEVVASHGDPHLGGDDIDELLYQYLLEQLPEAAGDGGEDLTSVARNRLRRAAEEAKIRLSDEPFTRVLEDNLETVSGERLHLEVEVERLELEELMDPLLDRTLTSVRQALAASSLRPAEIDEVLLVGGSTRAPVVAERLKSELRLDPRRDLHPDLAVAYGAGVMAARLMGSDEQRILVDITPYTFGTAAVGMLRGQLSPNLFCPVIRAGTPLPVSRSELFGTMNHGQRAVRVTVFEGEHEDAARNILIGQFTVEGLDPDAPASSPILLNMALDLDGILRVTAIEKNTGLSRNVVIERALRSMTDEDLKASRQGIDELFGHVEPLGGAVAVASEERAAAEAGDAGQEAKQVLRRLRGVMPEMDEVDLQDAKDMETRLLNAMEGDAQGEAVEALIGEIEDLLFYVESE